MPTSKLPPSMESLVPPRPECTHAAVMPSFNEEAAGALPAAEVRRLWPRFCGTCPTCNEQVILYASLRHYLAGDW